MNDLIDRYLAAVARGLMISAQTVPELANVFTTYAATTPQINLKLDRERAQQLGVSISDIFSAMQTTLGGTYTNDFNLFGRVWQVKVQADAPDRGNAYDVFRVRIRSSNGELVPLPAVANIELVTAPSSILRHHNLLPGVVNGPPAPGPKPAPPRPRPSRRSSPPCSPWPPRPASSAGRSTRRARPTSSRRCSRLRA